MIYCKALPVYKLSACLVHSLKVQPFTLLINYLHSECYELPNHYMLEQSYKVAFLKFSLESKYKYIK